MPQKYCAMVLLLLLLEMSRSDCPTAFRIGPTLAERPGHEASRDLLAFSNQVIETSNFGRMLS